MVLLIICNAWRQLSPQRVNLTDGIREGKHLEFGVCNCVTVGDGGRVPAAHSLELGTFNLQPPNLQCVRFSTVSLESIEPLSRLSQ